MLDLLCQLNVLTLCYLERGKSHGATQADEGVDGKEKALLLVGTGEENQHPEVHGRQGEPIGTAEVLNCREQVKRLTRDHTAFFSSTHTNTHFTHHWTAVAVPPWERWEEARTAPAQRQCWSWGTRSQNSSAKAQYLKERKTLPIIKDLMLTIQSLFNWLFELNWFNPNHKNIKN